MSKTRILKWGFFCGAILTITLLLVAAYIDWRLQGLAEDLELALYPHAKFVTLLQEVEIAQKVQNHFRQHESFPTSIDGLLLEFSNGNDVWGNPFILRRIDDDRFLVQSLGRTGKNAFDSAVLDHLKVAKISPWHEIGGNIVFVASFSEPVRLNINVGELKQGTISGEPLNRNSKGQ